MTASESTQGISTAGRSSCPRDYGELKPRSVKGLRVFQCDRCSGLWLPADVVSTAIGRAVPSKTTKATFPLLTCPNDGHPLETILSHSVVMDVCSKCGGIWLDRGELDQILRRKRVGSVASGAVEVASYAPDVAFGALEVTGEILSAVLECVVEALSGL